MVTLSSRTITVFSARMESERGDRTWEGTEPHMKQQGALVQLQKIYLLNKLNGFLKKKKVIFEGSIKPPVNAVQHRTECKPLINTETQ